MRKSKIREATLLFSKLGTRARKAQLAAMTPEARSEMMRKVANARYAKDKDTPAAGAHPQAAPAS